MSGFPLRYFSQYYSVNWKNKLILRWNSYTIEQNVRLPKCTLCCMPIGLHEYTLKHDDDDDDDDDDNNNKHTSESSNVKVQ